MVPLLGLRARGLGARRDAGGRHRDRGDARPRMGSTGTRVLLGGTGPRRRAATPCTACTRAARPWPWHRSPGPFTVDVEAASNPSFPQFRPSPLGSLATAGDDPQYVLARADVVLVDLAAEALLYDFAVLDEVMRTRPAHDQHRARTRRVLAGALDAVAAGAPPADVRRLLAAELARPAGAGTHRVVATGHAHIDTAWLWPTRETVRKCVRTFSSAVRLLDADPEHRFVVSQAQQYEWVRQREPELFARIAEKVAAGQWIPVGGQWVEADMNLPSGESLVRQIVHGQRYFEEHFGVRCTEMWIPDVFGYPAGLPQLFRAGGMDRFVTQKLSWNRTNRFPHHTFWWEGLDGSRVLTHFPPVDTYNAELRAGRAGRRGRALRRARLEPVVARAVRLRRRRRRADAGDARVRSPPAPTSTACRRSSSARRATFFDHVEAEAAAGAPVPVWRGELYFETHRGTLTSQLAHQARQPSLRAAAARVRAVVDHAAVAGRGDVDPHALDATLARGADPAVPRHPARLVDRVGARRRRGRRSSASPPTSSSASPTPLGGLVPAGATVVANAAGVDRDEVIDVDGVAAARPRAGARAGAGSTTPSARELAATQPSASPSPSRSSSPTARWPTAAWRCSWDLDGNLTSVIDVARGRELVPAGRRGAVLELAADRPVRYDAWDVESWTVEQGVPVGGVGVGHRRAIRTARRGGRRCDGPSAHRRRRFATCCAPGRLGSTWRSRSTGTTTSTCCRWCSPSTCTPSRRRAACSSARCADRRTPRRRGMPPSSRCAPIATSTSPSRRSASPCSTTGATATASTPVTGSTPCASAWPGRRSTPTRAPTSVTTR